jgi:hypothetical protein
MGGLGQPVVGVGSDDRASPPGGRTGDPPGKVVGLASGVHDQDRIEFRRQGGFEPLGEFDDRLVQVATVSRQKPLLLRHRAHDPRVAVADDGHVVVAIEITPVIGVVQPYAVAPDQMHRLLIEQRGARQRPRPAL